MTLETLEVVEGAATVDAPELLHVDRGTLQEGVVTVSPGSHLAFDELRGSSGAFIVRGSGRLRASSDEIDGGEILVEEEGELLYNELLQNGGSIITAARAGVAMEYGFLEGGELRLEKAPNSPPICSHKEDGVVSLGSHAEMKIHEGFFDSPPLESELTSRSG